MTRKETGSFRMKHPPDRQVAPAITEAVRNRKRNNELSCAQAERIAGQQQVDLAEIGVALDLLEVRIGKCQLGLFVMSRRARPWRPPSLWRRRWRRRSGKPWRAAVSPVKPPGISPPG